MIWECICPASCGEIVQGVIYGREMLVSYTVDVWSKVRLREVKNAKPSFYKAQKALYLSLKKLGLSDLYNHLEIAIDTDIPIGKGMSSSTADICAVVGAVYKMVGQKPSPDEIAEIALSIEPTNGIMYEEVVLFDHLEGKIKKPLGFMPRSRILLLEGKGIVNTQDFRSRDFSGQLKENEEEFFKAYKLVEKGFEEGDIKLIAEGATKSALLHQKILYKPYLEGILELVLKKGGLGINIAHSGTITAVIMDENEDLERVKKAILKSPYRFFFEKIYEVRPVKGGIRI